MKPENAIAKKTLRAACLTARAGLSNEARSVHATAFCRHFLNRIEIKDRIIAGYFPMRQEMDVLPLLSAIVEKGEQCCLPVTCEASRKLIFRLWQPGTEMAEGQYGIPVPAEQNLEVTPDVVIVPVVGFDDAQHRLGYGAGYYDRALAEWRKRGHAPLTVGAAYAVQQIDAVPMEPHDQALDRIITENGLLGVDF